MIKGRFPIFSRGTAPVAKSKRRDLFEVLVIYALILLVFWTPHPWQDILCVLSAASILVIVIRSHDPVREIVLSEGSPSCSLWVVLASIAVGGTGMVLAGILHTLRLPDDPALFLKHSFDYFLWAALQQFVVQVVFLARLTRLVGDPTLAAGTAALLFAVAHLPSPILMLISLVCGLAASLFFLRYRSLYPLAAAHAILGLSIAVSVPPTIDHNMFVGLAYVTYANPPAPLRHPARLPQP